MVPVIANSDGNELLTITVREDEHSSVLYRFPQGLRLCSKNHSLPSKGGGVLFLLFKKYLVLYACIENTSKERCFSSVGMQVFCIQ